MHFYPFPFVIVIFFSISLVSSSLSALPFVVLFFPQESSEQNQSKGHQRESNIFIVSVLGDRALLIPRCILTVVLQRKLPHTGDTLCTWHGNSRYG